MWCVPEVAACIGFMDPVWTDEQILYTTKRYEANQILAAFYVNVQCTFKNNVIEESILAHRMVSISLFPGADRKHTFWKRDALWCKSLLYTILLIL